MTDYAELARELREDIVEAREQFGDNAFSQEFE